MQKTARADSEALEKIAYLLITIVATYDCQLPYQAHTQTIINVRCLCVKIVAASVTITTDGEPGTQINAAIDLAQQHGAAIAGDIPVCQPSTQLMFLTDTCSL